MSLSRAGLGSHLRQLPRLSAFSGRAQYVPRNLLATKPPYQYNFSISVRTRINPSRPNLFRAFRPFRPRFNSSKPSPDINAQLGSPPSSLSFSQRLKALSKEYGWTAVGVYIGLSILDFPFCFLAVRVLGTDRIGRWEHAVIEKFWGILAIPFPSLGMKTQPVEGGPDVAREGAAVAHDTSSHNEESAGILTQLALAYAVHKSLIFFRVPLAAAILPSVVKTLRRWGWNVGRSAKAVAK